MRAKSWPRGGISEMARACFTARTSRSAPITSTMGSGSRTCERGEATATTTMRTCTWASGKLTSAMASESCSIGSRTGIRGSGRMT